MFEQSLPQDRAQVERYCRLVGARAGKPVAGLLWYIDVDSDEAVDVD